MFRSLCNVPPTYTFLSQAEFPISGGARHIKLSDTASNNVKGYMATTPNRD